MQKRNIVTMILLFLFTFGIYPIIWTCKFQGELKAKTGAGFGAVAHFFMLLITFGIYGLYWQYAAGKRLAKLGAQDRSILYLVLGIFFGIINPFLMQLQANEIN